MFWKNHKKRTKKKGWKRFLLDYGLHLWVLVFVINIILFYSVHFYTMAQTCFTTAQVQGDSRCLYIMSSKVYEKGSRSTPHQGHPCGTDVTSVVPASHTNSPASYLVPNYLGDICTAQPTDTPTPTPSTTPSNQPICSNLTIDKPNTGVAPLTLNFTANGSASNGTVSKVVFTFGDGKTFEATDSASLGNASANVSTSHTYTNPGSYQATATFTDNNGISSVVSSGCTQNITVTASASAITARPTMPATGSDSVAVGLGLAFLAVIIGGGFLFFVL